MADAHGTATGSSRASSSPLLLVGNVDASWVLGTRPPLGPQPSAATSATVAAATAAATRESETVFTAISLTR